VHNLVYSPVVKSTVTSRKMKDAVFTCSLEMDLAVVKVAVTSWEKHTAITSSPP
jgi:hypothetical protein